MYVDEKVIEIIAEIDEESKVTEIKINGQISSDVEQSSNITENTSLQTITEENTSNLITGNAVNELGLETDLRNILEAETAVSNDIVDNFSNVTTNNALGNNKTTELNESAISSNTTSTIAINESNTEEEPKKESKVVSENKFTIYSVDEYEVIGKIKEKTMLSEDTIRASIKFKHKEPEYEESKEELKIADGNFGLLQNNNLVSIGSIKVDGSITANSISTAQTNNSFGNFNIIQHNETCAGFRFGSRGGLILSCAAS